jgi:hypothetical protein
MTGITNSRHAWPDEGVTRVPYFVYEDADLYEDEQRLIFRGPVWNYLGLEIEIPTAGDYITSHVGDTPVIVPAPRGWEHQRGGQPLCPQGFDDLLSARRTCVGTDLPLSQLGLRL